VRAYHLFYADGAGSPGTDLTFFDFDVPAERRGGHVITRTSLRIHGDASFTYWQERLAAHGVTTAEPINLGGRKTLRFEDPEGQRLALVEDDGLGDDPTPWDGSPVPTEHQIRGLGPVRAAVPNAAPTEALLTHVFGLEFDRAFTDDGHSVQVYRMGEGGAHAELHLEIRPDLPPARPGAGGVHHVALRIQDGDYDAWAERLLRAGVANSGPVDRFWFKSLYIRDGNGLLFELATDGPGFAVDEDPNSLGETLVLPPFLEPRRTQIEANLKPL
jgi:glyoxalase family protein